MQPHKEYERLATVILYSERVKEFRKKAKLQENEFIVEFCGGSTTTRTMKQLGGAWVEVKRETKKLYPGRSDMIFYDKEIAPLLLSDIIQFFQIDLPEHAVFQAVLCNPPESP